eukprot:4921216-Pyramimonas_sp.AAC.1
MGTTGVMKEGLAEVGKMVRASAKANAARRTAVVSVGRLCAGLSLATLATPSPSCCWISRGP